MVLVPIPEVARAPTVMTSWKMVTHPLIIDVMILTI
jgi:hypothetical protein